MLVHSLPAQAQGSKLIGVGSKVGTVATKGTSAALRKLPVVKAPTVRPVSVPVMPAPASSVSRAVSGSVVKAPQVPAVAVSPDASTIHRLEQSVQNLRKENSQLKAALTQMVAHPSLRHATFMAEETTDRPTNPFSGTVFKTVYNGEEEIFGVVASHAIAQSTLDRALHRHFTMSVFDGEKMVKMPAEIVQLSSPSMLDVALVKFSPEAEPLFHPLRISEGPVQLGETLSSQGFAGNKDVNIPERKITKVTPLSVRTTLPIARDERPGLCGSAVVNGNKELVGIHTGSTYDRQDAQFDVGYATNASFLNKLVEAYHNGGNATFPLILNGREIIPLNVDEYISYVSFQDAEGKQLWQKGFDSKFSYSQVQEMLEIYSPRYIMVTVRRAAWDPKNPEILSENRSSRDLSKVTYKYDWESGEVVSVTRAKDKARR